ncbi:MAG TPA: hypothetical protein VNE71_15100, partial [Myxococcota bacterium]|nr:hypothetical protein [Myxococcota bacterium]
RPEGDPLTEEVAFAGRVEGGRRLKPQDPGKPEDTRVLLVKIAFQEATPLKLGQRVEVRIENP